MKALEFETKLDFNASLKVPDEFAAQIPKQKPVRVIVLLPEDLEEADWRRLTSEQFARGYGDSDSIYDDI